MVVKHKKEPITYLILIFLTGILAACSNSSKQGPATEIPEVSVIVAKSQSIDIENKLTGRLEPIKKSEVRARVSGVIKKILFTEGSMVKQGDPLFLLDDSTIKAQVAKARAGYNQALNNFNKIKPLLAYKAISKNDYDNALNTLQAAQADLNAAQINLEYAHITAPISGRIGKAYKTEGALVGQGDVTLLAIIQQEDELKIDINQSVNDYMKLKKYAETNQPGGITNFPFEIILNDGSTYPESGKILFVDNNINEQTGQITIKGVIPNSNYILLPGLFVTIKIKVGSLNNVYLIPVKAVTHNEAGGQVTIIKQDGSYENRQINVINEDTKYTYSTNGINEGELILVEGQMKLIMRPNKVSYKIIENKP